jgi:hypothetical protein
LWLSRKQLKMPDSPNSRAEPENHSKAKGPVLQELAAIRIPWIHKSAR